jgi:hypothetical protein
MTSHGPGHGPDHDKIEQTYSNDNRLSRQVTYQLSAEQYERLFLQPSAAKGDLAKRLGRLHSFGFPSSTALTRAV